MHLAEIKIFCSFKLDTFIKISIQLEITNKKILIKTITNFFFYKFDYSERFYCLSFDLFNLNK